MAKRKEASKKGKAKKANDPESEEDDTTMESIQGRGKRSRTPSKKKAESETPGDTSTGEDHKGEPHVEDDAGSGGADADDIICGSGGSTSSTSKRGSSSSSSSSSSSTEVKRELIQVSSGDDASSSDAEYERQARKRMKRATAKVARRREIDEGIEREMEAARVLAEERRLASRAESKSADDAGGGTRQKRGKRGKRKRERSSSSEDDSNSEMRALARAMSGSMRQIQRQLQTNNAEAVRNWPGTVVQLRQNVLLRVLAADSSPGKKASVVWVALVTWREGESVLSAG